MTVETPGSHRPSGAEGGQGASLVIRNVSTHYFTETGVAKALRGFSLDIQPGEMFGLVGGAASGKSTLAKSIMGLIQPPGRVVEGEILLFGEDLRKKSPAELDRIRGADIALIASNARSSLHPLYPVGNQIMNAVRAHQPDSRDHAYELAINTLREVGIDTPQARMGAYPHELSGGMAQRIAIAMALVNSPRVIIADEPAAGLDVTIRAQVLRLMVKLIRDHGATTLLITQDLGVVAHFCDRVGVMHEGQLVEVADVGTFFKQPQHPYSRRLIESVRANVDPNTAKEGKP